LYQPRQILLVVFYTVVCGLVMGSLIGACLIHFGRRMYLQAFPLNWGMLAGAILAATTVGSRQRIFCSRRSASCRPAITGLHSGW
jgi:hypothetical protein